MASFADTTGRKWHVTIDVGAIRRVRSLVGVDLMEVAEGKLVDRLAIDVVLLCDVLFAVLGPQALEHHVSDEQFASALGGDTIEHATAALLEGLVNFFPRDRRAVLSKVLALLDQLRTRQLAKMHQRLDDPALLDQAEAEIDRAIERARESPPPTPGSSSGSWPASPASTPTP